MLACPAQVQGPQAPTSLAVALQRAAAAGCDLAVVVRGGGSRADLAAFDAEPVARAVATAAVPVWTGIGHTGDQSVADLAANRSFITPTECGQELVRMVDGWWGSVAERSLRVARRAEDALAAAARVDAHARARLVSCTRRQLDRHAERLAARARQLAVQAPRQLEEQAVQVAARQARLGPDAVAQLQRVEDRLQAWRRLLAAYDPERQLERGYTLTLDATGRPLRSAAEVQIGAVLTTRFADGTARSTASSVELAGDAAPRAVPAGRGAPTRPADRQEVQ